MAWRISGDTMAIAVTTKKNPDPSKTEKGAAPGNSTTSVQMVRVAAERDVRQPPQKQERFLVVPAPRCAPVLLGMTRRENRP
jgi:hypothetical protein